MSEEDPIKGINISVSAETSHSVVDFCQRLLGPAAEAGEFLSEKIRFYRWKAALKTLSKAEKLSLESGVEPKEVPIKFLVPFLEKCSLEDESSELIECWANLLANATNGFKQEHITFSRILSEISSQEALILKEVCQPLLEVHGNANIPFSSFSSLILGNIKETISRNILPQWAKTFEAPDLTALIKEKGFERLAAFQKSMVPVGVVLTNLSYPIRFTEPIGSGINKQEFTHTTSSSTLYREHRVSIYSLVSLNLIGLERMKLTDSRDYEFVIEWIQPTPLAIDFLEACEPPVKVQPE